MPDKTEELARGVIESFRRMHRKHSGDDLKCASCRRPCHLCEGYYHGKLKLLAEHLGEDLFPPESEYVMWH